MSRAEPEPRKQIAAGRQPSVGLLPSSCATATGRARSVLRTAADKPDHRGRWLMNLATRRYRNIAIVVQANKTARIAWAILTTERRYRAA